MPPEIEDELHDEDGAGAAAAAGEASSLRSSLADAWDEFEAEGQSDQGAGQGAPIAAKPTGQDQAEGQGDRARDNQGRFAKPGEAAQVPKPTDPNASQGQAAPQDGTIRVPPGLSAATKADFAKLPPHVQQDMLKWQQDIETAKTTWDQKAARFNRLTEVLSPLQDRLQVNGVDEATFVQQLVAANDWLDKDPVTALMELGRQKGVNWQTVFQRLRGGQPGAQQQQQQAPLPPQLQGIATQVQSLTNWATQQQRAAEQSQVEGHLNTVKQFAADPANLYFENVREAMGKLLKSGVATDLPDAYQRACWADPQIRPLMLQSEEQQRAAKLGEQRRAKAAQARHASGSLTGSPSPGASPGARQAQPKSIRGSLSANWDALSG